MGFKFTLSLISLSILLLPSAWASVLAIDYGTDWTKASLMKSGVPFDVLLNKDSKRKIHSSVGWNRDDRLFSTDGFNIATRFPKDSFPSLKHVLGSQYGSNKTSFYSQVSQAVLLETDRGTVSLVRTHKGGSQWSVEELVAMQFAYVRSLAEDLAGERVTDVVLTVPAFFSHPERHALLDAVEIAGLRSLALINDGSAVSVNYAMTRNFPEKEHHIIFDAGAGSIRATVASFHSPDAKPSSAATKKINRNVKTTTKESAHIEVLGYGWDKIPSGHELTKRIRDKLVHTFEQKHHSSLAQDGRAMSRLWKEAERIKGVLSANAECISTVESLHGDVDFKTKTKRADFESDCADLKPLYAQPVLDALASSGLTWENITSIILMGGHSRVPMVQAAVREISSGTTISQNVNTDEAAVLGAAFYGASLSREFRTKKIKLQDVGVHDIQVSYPAEGKTSGRTINTIIFPRLGKANVKKTLTLKQRKGDFSLRLSYKTSQSTPEFPQEISEINISNVTSALANLTSRGASDPVVKVTLLMSESGVISVHDAVAFGEVKDDSLTGKLKNLFGAGSSSSSSSPSPSPSPSPSTSDLTSSGSSSTPSPSTVPAEPPAPVDPKKDAKNNVPLEWSVGFLSIRPLSSEEKSKSRSRLIALDAAERAKEQQAEARNILEGHVYRLRDLLAEAESGQTLFKDFSTVEERSAISSLLETTSEWLSSEGESSDTAALQSKTKALRLLEYPIEGRSKEFDAIPASIQDLHKALDAAKAFLKTATAESKSTSSSPTASEPVDELDDDKPVLTAAETLPVVVRWTPEEIDEVEKLVGETQIWLTARIEEVGGKPKNVDAPYRAAEVDSKGIKLQKAVLRLANRKAPAKPKPKKTKTTTSTSEATSTASVEPAAKESQIIRDEL